MLIDDFAPKPRSGASTPKPVKPKITVVSEKLEVKKAPMPDVDLTPLQTKESALALPPLDKKKTKRRSLREVWRSWTKRRKIIFVTATTIILFGASGAVYWFVIRPQAPKPVVYNSEPSPTPTPEPPKPITVASSLTGVQVPAEANERPVTAIMIENSVDARPQSGLLDAGIIFEAIAEGGITRFVALYQEGKPDYIGPVRSIRPYYIDWFTPFEASIAHVGGSKDALEIIRDGAHRDLDQFFNGDFYERITQRYAPHNVYTSMQKLDSLNSSKGYTKSKFSAWPRKQEAPLEVPTASAIDIAISGFTYNPHYDYDKLTNSYQRSQAGKTHIDERSEKQLSPKVVIAMAIPSKIVQASDGQRMEYVTSGSGQARIYQDGGFTEATWKKADSQTQLTFINSSGEPIPLNPGQAWLSVVDDLSDVTHQ